MTRRLPAICVVVMISLFVPVRAHAASWDNFWDYLDHLTGPGPFHGKPSLAGTVVCRNGSEWQWIYAVENPKLCVYVEWRTLEAERKAPFGEVTANLVESGVSIPVSFLDVGQRSFVEAGAAVGFAKFASPIAGVKKPVTKHSFTVTPFRIAVKPLKLVWNDTRAGFLQIVFRSTVRVGHLTAADFGVPGSTWESDSEVISKFFRFTVAIDVLQALRRPPNEP